ncbi:MAG: T9SS type A sorting domain-containing protein, partial [Candidatus Marinimicrobia bacterium]|nr:T9SS type A sorting domain-containing protein [Candidatus Neomarinimicrobiota bacterium]
ISVFNKTTAVVDTASGWTAASQSNYAFNIKLKSPGGTLYPADYEIRFSDAWVDTSSNGSPAKFTVWNLTEDKPSAFFFRDFNGDGIHDIGESMYIRETVEGVTLKTWEINFALPAPLMDTTWITPDSMVITEIPIDPIPPMAGDIFQIRTTKPFRSGDVFRFPEVVTAITFGPNETNSPYTYSLLQNYPNPFNPETTINYTLPIQSQHTLKVYNLLGAEVATLVNEVKPAGAYSVTWNARRFASGIYFFRLEADGYHNVKKMVLLK